MLKPKCILFLAVILCSSSILCNAYNDGAIAQLVNLCSNIEVRALSHNNLNDYPGYGSKGKRTPMWFGPRMGKRSELNLDSVDDQPGPVTVDDMFSNVHGLVKRELDDKLGPDSQWVVYLVNEFPNKYMTPRMGRELSERCMELHMVRPPMGPRMGRKV